LLDNIAKNFELVNYTKYSKQQFAERGIDSSAARQLAGELENDVAAELHAVVSAAFLKIIDGLNAQGHNLALCGEAKVGDISFRDEPQEDFCFLRLACDTVISAGYANTEPPSKAKDIV
jgi:hypothetical protein